MPWKLRSNWIFRLDVRKIWRFSWNSKFSIYSHWIVYTVFRFLERESEFNPDLDWVKLKLGSYSNMYGAKLFIRIFVSPFLLIIGGGAWSWISHRFVNKIKNIIRNKLTEVFNSFVLINCPIKAIFRLYMLKFNGSLYVLYGSFDCKKISDTTKMFYSMDPLILKC